MTTTVLPQIDSFTKTERRESVEDYEDVNLSTSPISSDSETKFEFTNDVSIKYERQQDAIITYGADEAVENYENVSFRNMLTEEQYWGPYQQHMDADLSLHTVYPPIGGGVPNATYPVVEPGQVVPTSSPFELEPSTPIQVPQYYSDNYPVETAHRVSVIVGNPDPSDVQYQNEYQSPFFNTGAFYPTLAAPCQPFKRKEKRKEKKKASKSVIYFEKSELTPDHKNGIHLWQFLLSLLRQPKFEKHIKWIDQSRGIFKIEDSQEVARLWGLRKNRPNMNYDKLSRSIRQYYKKNIIKKPKETSRLVYQFCDKIISDANFAEISMKAIVCE